MPHLPTPTGSSNDLVLALAITICTGLLMLLGWFLVRTLKQVEDAIQAGRAETAALRTELATVKADLKGYSSLVQHLTEETAVLKRAYAALERAFTAMDKWLYGQAMQGKLPQPPNFRPITPD